MPASTNTGNQKKANNRAARKRRERQADTGYDIPERGTSSTTGTKGARRRHKG